MANPYTHDADFRQERDFGQKISATFEFIGVHWRPLGRVMLYLVVPLALVQGILTAIFQSRLLGLLGAAVSNKSSQGALATQRAMMGATFQSPVYYLNIVIGLLSLSMIILSTYGYLVYCLRPAGAPVQPITAAEVWSIARRRLIGTFFSIWGLFLFVMLGFLVLFFPGMYLSVGLSLFFVVSIVEETGFFTSIGRSLQLTKGKWWSTYGQIFIMTMLLYLVLVGVSLVINLFKGVRDALLPSGSSEEISAVFVIINSAFFTAAMLLFYPPVLMALAFQYFNLVERKEGVGMRHLVDQLGQAAPLPGPTATTYRPDDEGEY